MGGGGELDPVTGYGCPSDERVSLEEEQQGEELKE